MLFIFVYEDVLHTMNNWLFHNCRINTDPTLNTLSNVSSTDVHWQFLINRIIIHFQYPPLLEDRMFASFLPLEQLSIFYHILCYLGKKNFLYFDRKKEWLINIPKIRYVDWFVFLVSLLILFLFVSNHLYWNKNHVVCDIRNPTLHLNTVEIFINTSITIDLSDQNLRKK